MREILFRAIRTDNREWVYGYYVKQVDAFGAVHRIYHSATNPDDSNHVYSNHVYDIDKNTVGQYTGITLPTTGERIFEGDLLYSEVDLDGNGVLTSETLCVYWDDKLHGLLLRSPEYELPCDLDTDLSDFRLIGNIYDDDQDYWRQNEKP